ncbi:hypothetical protein E6P78_21030 [Streptomyces sp. A0958]|nr:hypothetical protein E6P78_21030 [Streptomyces sp. A0958]
MGLLCVLAGAVLLALVPGTVDDVDAYAAAPACRAGQPRSAGCTTAVPATVRATENVSTGRGVRYWLTAAERDAAPGADAVHRIHMVGTKPVYSAVRPGDEVTLVYWRGEIRTVRFGAVTQETKASPSEDWRFPVAFGLLLVPFGLVLLHAAWWYRYRYPSATHMAPMRFMVWPLTFTLVAVTGFTAGLVGSGIGNAFTVTAFAVVPLFALSAVCAWWLQRRSTRAADTSDIVPVAVEGVRCVSASVHGDVPYSVAGFGTLVLGDGRPAATPDPTGRVARRPLPGTLTVRGVRGLRPGDPEAWYSAYKYDAAVIECRDGDRTVLIGAPREEAGLILGALARAD